MKAKAPGTDHRFDFDNPQPADRSRHARTRAQQRAVPRLIDLLLDTFGQDDFDGHGGCRTFFSKTSKRNMERAFGRAPVKKLSQWLDVYRVENSRTGEVITIARRHRHLKRG